jgi:hypothetical protein
MQVNWQSPFQAASPPYWQLSESATLESRKTPAIAEAGPTTRDRIDYRLIFGACLLVLLWVGLIERCNPFYWRGRNCAHRSSLWSTAKRSAHHLATMAFQG